MLTFGAAEVKWVCDVASQTDVQWAAKAFILWLCDRVGQYTVFMVELPTQRDHTALHPIT